MGAGWSAMMNEVGSSYTVNIAEISEISKSQENRASPPQQMHPEKVDYLFIAIEASEVYASEHSSWILMDLFYRLRHYLMVLYPPEHPKERRISLDSSRS